MERPSKGSFRTEREEELVIVSVTAEGKEDRGSDVEEEEEEEGVEQVRWESSTLLVLAVEMDRPSPCLSACRPLGGEKGTGILLAGGRALGFGKGEEEGEALANLMEIILPRRDSARSRALTTS